jgi:hypothetical protein
MSRHIHGWFPRDGTSGLLPMLLPADALHLVLLNTQYCAMAKLHFQQNLIEVTVLKEQEVGFWFTSRPTKFENG